MMSSCVALSKMFGIVSAAVILLTSGLSGIIGWDSSLSAYMRVKENRALEGFVLDTRWMFDTLSCAQRCLAYQGCLSVNYETYSEHEMGVCEFNNYSAKTDNILTYKDGSYYVDLFQVEVLQYTFTSLNASGRDGPSDTMGYINTSLEGAVKLDKGIQHWSIPYTGTYIIEAFGASGQNGTYKNKTKWKLGGLGARIKGTFYFKRGTKIKILVGQQGTWTCSTLHCPGPGGGGSFVTLSDNTPLLIAGGGGGGSTTSHEGFTDGDPGQETRNGSRYGGSFGNGGNLTVTKDGKYPLCSAGSGLLTKGRKLGFGESSSSFIEGGRGGTFSMTGDGGFGGGGYSIVHGGGGGGYSGGGVVGNNTSGTAGGGGSFNAGLVQRNTAGVNKGDGRVIVTLVEREI